MRCGRTAFLYVLIFITLYYWKDIYENRRILTSRKGLKLVQRLNPIEINSLSIYFRFSISRESNSQCSFFRTLRVFFSSVVSRI